MKYVIEASRLRNAINLALAATVHTVDPREQTCHIFTVSDKVYFYAGGQFTVCSVVADQAQENSSDVLSFSLQQLSRIFTPFTNSSVSIESRGNTVSIKAAKLSATLSTIDSPEEIDYVFSFDAIAIVPVEKLKSAIKNLGPIASVGVSNITGQLAADQLQFFIDGNILTIQATDGVKYGAIYITGNKSSEQTVFTLSARTLNSIFSAFNPIGNTNAIISKRGANLISIGSQDYFFTIPKIESKLRVNPDKARQLLTASHQMFTCQREELLDAVESAASLYKKVKDAKLDVKVELDISKYDITVATCICPRLNSGSNIGTDRIIREVDFKVGSDGWHEDIITLHFNANVLQSVISAASTDEIECWFGKDYQPMIISPHDEESEDIFAAMPLGSLGQQPPPMKEAVTPHHGYKPIDPNEPVPF